MRNEDSESALLDAVERLLESPDLNVDELEEETRDATAAARCVIDAVRARTTDVATDAREALEDLGHEES